MTGKSLLTVKAYDIQAHGWVKDRKSHFCLFFHTNKVTHISNYIITTNNY